MICTPIEICMDTTRNVYNVDICWILIKYHLVEMIHRRRKSKNVEVEKGRRENSSLIKNTLACCKNARMACQL